MAIKFKKHNETVFAFNGRALFQELRNRGISRDTFAERMEETTGVRWYPSKVVRMENQFVNYITKETMQAMLKALQ